MKRIVTLAVAALTGAAFAEKPDKWVSYVEATGSQYVDTGIIGRWNTKIETKVEWMNLADTAFVSCGDWSSNARFYLCYCCDSVGRMLLSQGTNVNVRLNSGYESRFQKNRVYDYRAEFSATNGMGQSTGTVTMDGFDPWSNAYNGLNTGRSLFVFANNRADGLVEAQSKARCYGLKIWQGPIDGGDMTLVRDFYPCMKNKRAALYDAVSQTIFYSGSGTDLICDERSEEPDEFIEYVESHGEELAGGQLPAYIDTGIIGKSGTKMSGEFAILKDEDNGFLGSRAGDSRFYLLQSWNSKITCGYGAHKENSNTLTLGKKYLVETELNAGSQVERIGADGVTNTVYSASDSTSIDTGYPMCLFACNVDGKPQWYSKARCYGFKMWQNGSLVRDFRPCLKNGVAGLYDDVSKRIFYSLGTPLVFDNRRKAPKKKEIVFVEYIESDGNNTLDTGVPARSGLRAAGDMMWIGPIGDADVTELRTWEHEVYRYLEQTGIAPIFYRQQRAYLSAVKPSPESAFYMIHAYNRELDVAYGSSVYPKSDGATIKPTIGTKYSFDVTLADGSQTLKWGEEGQELATVLSTNLTGSIDTGTSLYLFSSSYWRHRSIARCYGLKIWDGSTLVRDFKPCLVDGKGMLYDEVTETLYRPSPDIPASRTGNIIFSGLEKPAQHVDYVESDGTIFVDTGVIGKSGTKAKLDVTFLEDNDRGCLDSRRGNDRFYLFHNGSTEYGILYGYGDYFNIGTPSIGTRYHVESSLFTGSQLVWINGELKGKGSNSTAYDTNLSLYLFACHQNGSPTYPGVYRFYSLKLWQGNADGSNLALLRDFKPVKLTNGLVVLWDYVNNEPYLPQSATSPYKHTTFPVVGPDGERIYTGSRVLIR